jgi:3-hydroxymyristoyl/3-hydroxydecanoyl-(acyl carrier protein) dehydratase
MMNMLPLEEKTITAQLSVDSRSPWFAGHFPGDPILPGIAQLKMVAETVLASGRPDMKMVGVSRVKFRKIVRPGKWLDIHVAIGKKEGQYAFRITCENEEICSGMMHFAIHETP